MNNNKLPTAEEFLDSFYRKKGQNMFEAIEQSMIEFAKLHVEAALKKASEDAKMYDANEDCHYMAEDGSYPEDPRIDRDTILNSYSLDNIK